MGGQSNAVMLSVLAAACLGAASCWSHASDSGEDCPNVVVAIDGGLDAFSGVGDWGSGAVCSRFCEPRYTQCQLLSATTLKCQKGCM